MDQETSGLVDVILQDAGPRMAGVHQLVRTYATGLTSKQALKLVKAAPGPVITGIARVQAEALKIQFEALGAAVQLTPSSVS